MIKSLGASLEANNMKTFFPHPMNDELKVYVFLDVCHMLKLVRNTLGQSEIIVDELGNKIRWFYIVELQKLQENEGFHLANKLRKAHVKFNTQKMKVNLATQTLSSSVAVAIDFCNKTLKLPQFIGSEATVRFIMLFDRLFDILNSRNPFGKGFKTAMRPQSEFIWQSFLTEAMSYIFELRDPTGLLMIESRRKTGFIGFLAAIQSITSLYTELVYCEDRPLKYLLTYKFSQDHLELFFSAVRSSFGSNNNPTARQFTAAYKRLIVRNEIAGVAGNCMAMDSTSILFVTNSTPPENSEICCADVDSIIKRYDVELRLPSDRSDHDYVDLPNNETLSSLKEYVVSYISGFVVRKVRKTIRCQACIASLELKLGEAVDRKLQFVVAKNRGGLIMPSPSVVATCESTKRCIQRSLRSSNGNLPQIAGNKFVSAISITVLKAVGAKVFSDLHDHMFDSTPDNNHIFNLIKVICESYVTIRMHALCRRMTENVSGTNIRKKLTKLVLFNHQ